MPVSLYNRRRLVNFIEGSIFVTIITSLIIVNAVTLGLETNKSFITAYGGVLCIIDNIILVMFSFEILLKFYCYRIYFFRSGWNVFDLFIVTTSWLPSAGPFAILRALRILRVLRLLSVVPSLRRVISAIGHSIPGMFSVIGVLVLVFYISSVLTTKLFGHYDNPHMQEWFGTIGASAYTLFQIMTLESWSMGIVRPTMKLFPFAWLFFVPFIIITSFAVLNLFIGIIVDSMQNVNKETDLDSGAINHEEKCVHERLDAIQCELAELKVLITSNHNNRLD
ncbi:MAG: ion transporter [Hyphomicrobiaceae bacterium]|nr:ion transporter [Hyphomicrobiaceae bacterium]